MTIAEWIERVTRDFETAGLCFGHGTDNARDEAAWLVLHAAGAPLDGSFDGWGGSVDDAAAEIICRLARQRIDTRQPLAYLLGTAWFAGLEFEVSPDVLVPRSPLAELIGDGFRPWLQPERVQRVLDLCTGSGCIAVATARQLPLAMVDASDISPAALALAARNVRRHGLDDRVRLIRSDLFASIPRRDYDLITANPPYVPATALANLPPEYRAEPGLGLASGSDGLDAVLQILVDAPAFLGEHGILVCEVGESEQRLADVLPRLPFLWLEFEHGGSGVFLMTRPQLQAAAADLENLIGKRRNVA
jgi:ribosomal protein L3 glutamine methyltransferase